MVLAKGFEGGGVSGELSLATSQANLDSFQSSEYDGFSVPGWNTNYAYMQSLNTHGKDIWPWVMLAEISRNDPEIFDLNNTYGSRTALLLLWRGWLEVARDTGSPGIVFDPEFYLGDGSFSTIPLGATAMGISQEAFAALVEGLGAELIDAAREVYPTATIWMLWTFLDSNTYTCKYLAKGMLDRIVATNSDIKIIDGIEQYIPYQCPSVSNLAYNWGLTYARLTPSLAASPCLSLSAPLFLWNVLGSTTSWAKTTLDTQVAAGTLEFSSVYDLYQQAAYLKDRVDYVWVYNHPASDYRPFAAEDSASRLPFDRCLRHMKYRDRIVAEHSQAGVYDVSAALAEHDKNIGQGEYITANELEA
jgi:hypothetical protein